MTNRIMRAALLALPFAAACSLMRPRSSATPAPALTDANIAAIVLAADNADIAYAKQALAKSQTAAVREFATMTERDHSGVNEAAVALATRLKLAPQENQASLDLRDDADTKREKLRLLDGFAFDSAYIANEIAYHTSVLGVIDNALIPSAQNAELKALLVQARPAVAAHLEHGKHLASTLKR
jgi:putative membrane protein